MRNFENRPSYKSKSNIAYVINIIFVERIFFSLLKTYFSIAFFRCILHPPLSLLTLDDACIINKRLLLG